MIWRLWGIKAIYQGGIRAIWREPTLLVKIIIVIHDMSWLCARSQAWKGAVFSGDNEKTNNVYKEENLLFFFASTQLGFTLRAIITKLVHLKSSKTFGNGSSDPA